MKIKSHLAIILTALTISLVQPMSAQQRQFTLEDLNYGGYNYHKTRPRHPFLTWWGDVLMYQDAEESGQMELDGRQKPVFQISELGEGWHSAMNATYPYPDKPWVLLKNSRERVLYDFRKKEIVWRQKALDSEACQEWNSQTRATAFIHDCQLFVRDADGNDTQLTTDGSGDIVYGQSVHRNEFGINKGLFWSPDGQRLAFYRMDQSMVDDYPQVDIFGRMAACKPDKYPMAGMTSHQVTVGIYDMTTHQTVYLKTGEPADHYLTNISFSPDGREIYLFELNRDQNDCVLTCYDTTTGQKRGDIYRETSDKYVEPLHPIQFLPWNSRQFVMQSQKDGYNHLYLYDLDSKQLRPVTQGAWVVLDVLGFCEKTQSVIMASNEKDPLQCNLYSVRISDGKRTPLDNGLGVHQGSLSPSGLHVSDTYSTPDIASQTAVTDTQRPRPAIIHTHQNPWEGYATPRFESGTIKAADGITDLYYRMVKPADFDPKKTYPTIVYVYGGPHVHLVDASWHWASRPWETYMAQKGYIIFVLDGRGSENRGRDFEQVTFRQLGQVEMEDQMKGVDYLRSLPYVDTGRLGVHGWSFGGFMTISLMTTYPDVFKVGVAGGPVIDWKWYEVMYGERYMDTPQQNPEGYAKTSLTGKAGNLKGKLQIITGYNDDVVVPQHCLSFLAACIEAGTQPDFFAYPGEGHNMHGRQSVHLHERITQYFEDYLK